MNEHDIDEARRLTAVLELPNLHQGARILANLRDWANENSDGWPYWRLPSAASAKLQLALEQMQRDYYLAQPAKDITAAQLRKLCSPIKAFLTRRGVDHALVFKP